jgi:sodium transport system ATP-binding protein
MTSNGKGEVRVEGLEKTFWEKGRGEVRAVAGIDFTCHPGEVFGLLGANGAGKTTTLRMLATVLQPTSGSATVNGHDVRTAPQEVRRSLGFHSASTALYPRLTVRETLDFFARVNRYPADAVEERIETLLDRFALRSYADARVDVLSSGMKQKVSIARTVAHDPPVLVFDEPSVGLDVVNALELRRIVRELRDQGKAIIFSTHVMPEAERVCDRIGIMHRGRLLAVDTLERHRDRTGLHYLEDIFVAELERAGYDGAP